MKTHVAIYKNKEDANLAVEKLSDHKFPIEKVSIIERADIIEDHIKVKSIKTAKTAPILVFSVLGLITGILTSIFNITFGLDFLENTPLIISAFIGLDVGLIVGALFVIFIAIIIKKDKTIEINKHQESSIYLIVIDGSNANVFEAEKILKTEGAHKYTLVCTYCKAKRA